MLIIDAHLDLSHNAVSGRNPLLPARQQPADADGIPTVGLPDLRSAHFAMVCGTIFCMPSLQEKPGYRTSEEAFADASRQMDWYDARAVAGDMRLVRTRHDVPLSPLAESRSPLPTLVLMEGADPIRTPDDVAYWTGRGVRALGLAWRQTRYAGGTGAPGGLTAAGRELVPHLDQHRIIHDVSHLAEQSFWELLELSASPVMASHSNCRAIVPTDRQLSDEMIRAIVERGGVIGINFYDKFLLQPGEARRASLADVMRHAMHICMVAGNGRHVGIGTDMDGGLGREQIPQEIETSADLPRLAEAARAAGFTDADTALLMGGNWQRFLSENLPSDQSPKLRA
jgi:membrane dipeptidase